MARGRAAGQRLWWLGMVSERAFRLHLYSTKLLIVVLVGLVLLGTGILLVLQQIWVIPGWVQYLALTAAIAVAFVSSCYLAARPARLLISDRGLTIAQKGKDTEFCWIATRSKPASYSRRA